VGRWVGGWVCKAALLTSIWELHWALTAKQQAAAQMQLSQPGPLPTSYHPTSHAIPLLLICQVENNSKVPVGCIEVRLLLLAACSF